MKILSSFLTGLKEMFWFSSPEINEVFEIKEIKCVKCMDAKEMKWPLSDGSILVVSCECTGTLHAKAL